MTLSEFQKCVDGLSRKFQYTGDPFQALARVTEELGEVASEINKMYLSESRSIRINRVVLKDLVRKSGTCL